jgi:hypothetical protein
MKKHIKSSLIIIFLAILSSCGGSGSGGGSPQVAKPEARTPAENEEEVIENQPTPGSYRSFIRPINTRVFGRLNSGLAMIEVSEEDFNLHLYMDDASKTRHMQGIYTGGRCPSLKDDLNRDGFIDIQETIKVTGNLLIPLDGDLSTQAAGEKLFPSGMAYDYKKTQKLNEMLSDLKAKDPNERDILEKLKANEELNLEGRIIIIHGVVNQNNLPMTVASLEGVSSYDSIPVACGIIQRASAEVTSVAIP